MDYTQFIRDIPDFPQPGVLFRDITPLLKDPAAFHQAIHDLSEPFQDKGIDQVVAVEARGYLLGAPMAVELGAGFVPVRKMGKLPFRTYKTEYALEYGSAAIEMHEDALMDRHTTLLVDDVLATGGTMAGTIRLVQQSGAQIAGIAVLIELMALGGRAHIGKYPFFALMQM